MCLKSIEYDNLSRKLVGINSSYEIYISKVREVTEEATPCFKITLAGIALSIGFYPSQPLTPAQSL